MFRTLATALALALVLAAAPPAIAQVGQNVETPQTVAAPTYLTSAALRERAFAALFKAIGRVPPVSKIMIAPADITVWVQGAGAPHHTDEWTIRRHKLLVFDRDAISGPRPTDGDGIVSRSEESFFAFGEIGFEQLERAVIAGIGMAAMEQTPEVTSLIIARQIGVLPEPHYGEVRWTISLATGREQASIYADIGGSVLGADLSGTTRAKRLDLIAGNDWPMQQAEADIAMVLGTTPINELRVYDTYLYFTADTAQQTTQDYSWKLGGVSRGMEMPNVFGFGDTKPFALGEIDLEKLPDIKRNALAAFGGPGAVITYIAAQKPTDRASAPAVLWRVDLREPNGETGHVLLDAGAGVVETVLPESRAAKAIGPWLAPETVVATLRRLEKEFGPDARYSEILINDTQGSILVEDPQAPGQMASFIIDPQRVIRFGTPMPWEAEANPAQLFTIADLSALDAATLARFAGETVAGMNQSGMEVFRYTFSRHALIMNPGDNRMLVEIRAGKDDGWTSGWMTFELGGKVADVMRP